MRLNDAALLHPDKPALVLAPGPNGSKERIITYQELLDRSNTLARGFESVGITKGMRAALMSPPGIEFFALGFALLQAGIVPVIVDPGIGFHNVTECLRESYPSIFIGSPAAHVMRHVWGWGKDSVRINISMGGDHLPGRRMWGGYSLAEIRSAGQTAPVFVPAATHPEDEAAIIYTSGSTGLPKGAIYTHGNFSAQIDMLSATFDIHPDEIDLPAFPLFALIDFLMGVTAIVPDIRFPSPARVDPALLIRTIHQYGISNLFGSPVVIDKVGRYAAQQGLTLPALKRVITAGAPASPEMLERFRQLLSQDARLVGIYGATESLPITCIDSQEILERTRYLTAEGAGVCIGKPVSSTSIRIIPITDDPIPVWDDSRLLPPGQIGEIAVQSSATTAAYVSRPAANAVAKMYDTNGRLIHRMGDLGYVDPQGWLWYCGRKSHRVVSPERTLFTECVEGIFNTHPMVHRTALVGVQIDGITTPLLCVELQKTTPSPDHKKVLAELLALGAQQAISSGITRILIHPGFPTDIRHNSKIIREKLAHWAQEKIVP